MEVGGFGIITIVHAILALFLIIELGLIGYVVSEYNSIWDDSSPASADFMLFNAIWSILVLIYVALIPRFVPRLFLMVVSLGLLCLTSLFWFAGSIALAVRISPCDGDFCRTNEAAVAFGFLLWVGFTALAVLEGLSFWRARGNGAHADTRSKGSAPVV